MPTLPSRLVISAESYSSACLEAYRHSAPPWHLFLLHREDNGVSQRSWLLADLSLRYALDRVEASTHSAIDGARPAIPNGVPEM